jgi:hypothetical protein
LPITYDEPEPEKKSWTAITVRCLRVTNIYGLLEHRYQRFGIGSSEVTLIPVRQVMAYDRWANICRTQPRRHVHIGSSGLLDSVENRLLLVG